MEPATGFVPATLCLQNSCSTTELRRLAALHGTLRRRRRTTSPMHESGRAPPAQPAADHPSRHRARVRKRLVQSRSRAQAHNQRRQQDEASIIEAYVVEIQNQLRSMRRADTMPQGVFRRRITGEWLNVPLRVVNPPHSHPSGREGGASAAARRLPLAR